MVKKMKLELDKVQVESFDTTSAGSGVGTVHGHATQFATCVPTECCTNNTCETDCGCSGQWTCPGSINGTCAGGATCYSTCHTGQCICI
jgi:hypothetical protein